MILSNRRLLGIFALVFACGFAMDTQAQTTPAKDPLRHNPQSPWYLLNAESGWHFDLGAGMEYEPGYAGSDQYEVEPDVFARATYRTEGGHRYVLGFGDFGAIFSLGQNMQISAFLEHEEGREAEDDAALKGLDRVDSTIEGQFMLARRFGNATLYAILQPDLTGDANKGLVWFIGGSHDRFLANGALADRHNLRHKRRRCRIHAHRIRHHSGGGQANRLSRLPASRGFKVHNYRFQR